MKKRNQCLDVMKRRVSLSVIVFRIVSWYFGQWYMIKDNDLLIRRLIDHLTVYRQKKRKELNFRIQIDQRFVFFFFLLRRNASI